NDVASFSMFYVLNVKDMNRNGGIFGSNAGYFCFELATISNKGSLRIRQNDGNNPIITDAILFSPIDSWNMLSIVASNNNGKVWKNGITLSTTASNAKLPILPDVQQALGRYASDYGD